ncbi:hypothetical protein BN934_01622 [Lacticaseibacillus rhamnosus]|nr:hypothetical protein BN934_01622 [Lacticaseibacillus rhamnosus]
MFILKETKDKIKADWYRYEEKDFSLLRVLFKVLIKNIYFPFGCFLCVPFLVKALSKQESTS